MSLTPPLMTLTPHVLDPPLMTLTPHVLDPPLMTLTPRVLEGGIAVCQGGVESLTDSLAGLSC